MRTAIALALCLFAFPALAAEHLPGELLVILDHAPVLELGADGSLRAGDAELAGILEHHGLLRYEHLVQKRPEALSEREAGYLRLRGPADLDVIAASRELRETGLFRAVSPNWLHELLVTPNDPMLGSQWHVTSSTAGIHLREAWDVAQGGAGTVIAILDTGLDWSHPDLGGNAWHNPGEIPGNGVDDDDNGYVDDVYGWDCGAGDNDPRPEPYFEAGLDVGFHGTHCAGIASAATDNGVGIAGAGWDCSLMGLKLTGGSQPFSVASVTAAFNYAIDNGAAVISMSFGGDYADFGFMQALVEDANDAGVVCVAAAGNNDTSAMMYPAALSHVISVGATNSSNQRASFSTYGAWVDVAAPGEHIWSTIQSNYDFDWLSGLMFQMSYGWDGMNPYMYCDGTSMACPLVAGVCGLVKALAPWMDSDELEQHLIDTGDTVSYDQPIGKRVNAFQAVNGLGTAAPGDPAAAFGIRGNWPNPFNPKTEIRFALEQDGEASLAVYDASGRRLCVLADGPLAAGEHSVSWNGRDETGRELASGVYFVRLVQADRVQRHKILMLK